jgi:5-methylcytosine-specific restriction endonuclease McrA
MGNSIRNMRTKQNTKKTKKVKSMSDKEKKRREKREYMRSYRHKHKKELQQKRRAYNKKHREQINEGKRRWYHKNRKKSLQISKKYQEAHPVHMREYKHKWYIKNRDRILIKRKKDYDIPEKREKHKKYCREYSRTNRIKINEMKGKYRHTKKGKLIEKNHWLKRRRGIKKTKNMLTTNELEQIKKEYPYCVYCGSKKDLTTEHIKAIIKGGFHTKENVMIACSKCNASKNSTSLEDWLQKPYCQEKNINWKTVHPDILKFRK